MFAEFLLLFLIFPLRFVHSGVGSTIYKISILEFGLCLIILLTISGHPI